MYCTSCGHEVVEGQKFCDECGQSLAGVTEPTEALNVTLTRDPPPEFAHTGASASTLDALASDLPSDTVPDAGDLPTREITPREEIPDPEWAMPIGNLPTPAERDDVAPQVIDHFTAPVPAHRLPAVESNSTTHLPLADGFSTTTIDTDFLADPTGTDEIPAVFDGSHDIHEYPPTRDPFKLKLVFVFAFFGAIAVLMSAVADIVDIRTSAPVDGIATGVRTLDTLGTNLAVAGFFGASVMVLGGLLACFGLRWGAGLAGGAGLALIGWASIVAGLVELRVADAESVTRRTTEVAFTLKVTRDLGFWLVVAVAAIGALVALASLRSFGSGGRPALNPWIAALGAVAGVVMVSGPLLPEGNATFANNFRSADMTDLPTVYFAGRMLQLALIGGSVVFGLLIVRTYGLGLAAGGVSVAFWMWLTSVLDIGSFPLGIAAGNFGSPVGDFTPHAVTTVGMALTLMMLIIAAILAIVGNQRQRHYGY